MRNFWTIVLLALAALPTAVYAQGKAAPPPDDGPALFPKVTGDNLNGKTFRLPGDLGGERNIVVIAFEREHQAIVDTWLPMLAKTGKTDSTFRYYEIPTLSKMPAFARDFIDGGMRNGIPDTGVRAITITLYIDKAPFLKSLRIPDEKTIHVLLVDKQGTIHWRSDGAFTAAKGESLAKALARAPGKAK